MLSFVLYYFFFFKQKTAYDMRISDWSSDVCSSDLAAGRVDATILAGLLDNRYFDRRPPKSLDRDDFSAAPVAGLSLEDGAATLTAFTAATKIGRAHV